jgi:hypothetical protein
MITAQRSADVDPFASVWFETQHRASNSPLQEKPLLPWTMIGMHMSWPPAYTDPLSAAPSSSPWKTTVPPPYLFLGTNVAKQSLQFYILRCITPVWFPRASLVSTFNDPGMSLTIQMWRDVLHGSYWKAHWPRRGRRFDPTVDPPFEPATFWKYGGREILGDTPLTQDLIPRLTDGSKLSIGDFESNALKALVLWDLRVTQWQLYFQAADDHYARRVINREERAIQRRTLFRNNWSLFVTVPPWESKDKAVRRGWFARLRQFMKDWEIRGMAGSLYSGQLTFDEDLASMSDTEMDQYELKLVATLAECIVEAFQQIPPMLTAQPPLEGLEKFFFI